MSRSVVIAALWVVLASAVAFLPMRLQMLPGLGLLIAAPVVIVWLGIDHGWIVALVAVLALVSMFRKPLGYVWGRMRGQPGERGE